MLINKNALKTVINSLLMKINSKADKTDIIQSDWNQNDKTSSDYVKNRTHYDSRIFESKTYTFDGNMEGKEIVQVEEGRFYVKLSDDISITKLVDGTIAVYDNGGGFSEIITEKSPIDQATELVYYFRSYPIMVVLEDTEFDGMSLTKGIWSTCSLDGDTPVYYTKKLNYNALISGELHKLDNKYLDVIGACGTGQGAEIFNEYEGKNTASGDYSHSEGYNTTASGKDSHAEGYWTTASGDYSHAEGLDATASGEGSHAEGGQLTASGNYSHAEGWNTRASGQGSHAEGAHTDASGHYSHTEGYSTIASAYYSHAEGRGTHATCIYQHTQGSYNILDTAGGSETRGAYAHIVGNGTSNYVRSNAHTLDWDGNAWFAGDVYVGSTSGTNKDNGSVKLATENYVDNKIANNSVLSVDKGGTGYNSITDTTYTTARYRASALVTTETDPTINGVINWIYE